MAPLSAPADRRNLLIRILSGVALGPPVLALALWGGPVFVVVIAIFAALGLREWLKIVSERDHPIWYFALSLALAVYWIAGLPLAVATLAASTIIAGLVGGRQRIRYPWLAAFGLPYLGLTIVAMAWLHDLADGPFLAIFVLLIVWASDIGAYILGRAIGGPKLAPRISPKKTWAGLAGAVILAGIVGFGAAAVVHAARPMDAVIIGAGLALIGQGGDLFESSIKRRFNHKDSGDLIPGHGGVLDRIDALLWVVPVFAALHAAGATAGFLP